MAINLLTCVDKRKWETRLDQYDSVMRKKSELPKKNGLFELDKWYQLSLPESIASRTPKHLTKEELVKLMKWKLTRGKFRPKLLSLIEQNSEEDVRKISEKSFKIAKDITAAMKEISKLKAVGPATASAILCATNPEIYPCMADEPMALFPGLQIDYTVKNYTEFQKHLVKRAEELNQDGDSEIKWTPHKVELALWTDVTGKKLGMNLDPELGDRRRKRKHDTEHFAAEAVEDDKGKREK